MEPKQSTNGLYFKHLFSGGEVGSQRHLLVLQSHYVVLLHRIIHE